MKPLSIQQRLMALLGISLLITLLVAGVSWTNSRQAREATEDLVASTESTRAAMNADMMHDAIRADVLSAQMAALSNDDAALDAAQKDLASHVALLRQSLETARKQLPPEARSALEAALPSVDAYLASTDKVMAALKARSEDSKPRLAEFMKAFADTEKALDVSGDTIEKAADAINQDAQALLRRGEHLTLGLMITSAILLPVLSLTVTRSIVEPLRQMRQAVSNLNQEDGDLSRRLPPASAEFGEVSLLFNQFLAKIAQVVGRVQDTVGQMASTSNQIASGNLELSHRTEASASNLQQAASSVEEITSTVHQSAESARQASALAATASEVAVKGGEAVARVVSTMEEINVASRKISDIISVIDGIAFQTNILALNAAVEAARAGEQGRGFAVVAGEVRSLAQRSAEAAREIKSLIGTSVDKVEAGSQLVRDAGATMGEIVASVSRVSHMIQEISHAAAEQSTGILLVNQTVNDLDRATQQNAALVEETAAVAKEMAEQASALENTVKVFRIASDRPPA